MHLDSFPETLTAEMIAEYLTLSKKTVYGLFKKSITEGGIPSYRCGMNGPIRVDKADFIKWLEDCKANKFGQSHQNVTSLRRYA